MGCLAITITARGKKKKGTRTKGNRMHKTAALKMEQERGGSACQASSLDCIQCQPHKPRGKCLDLTFLSVLPPFKTRSKAALKTKSKQKRPKNHTVPRFYRKSMTLASRLLNESFRLKRMCQPLRLALSFFFFSAFFLKEATMPKSNSKELLVCSRSAKQK